MAGSSEDASLDTGTPEGASGDPDLTKEFLGESGSGGSHTVDSPVADGSDAAGSVADGSGAGRSRVGGILEQADGPSGPVPDGGSGSKDRGYALADGSGGVRRRVVGLVALLLGAVGVLASLLGAGFGLRVLFGAGGMAEAALEPVAAAVDRMETRIDQTDDALSNSGVPSDQIDELQARAQGLADLTDSAVNSFNRVNEHPVYQYFPAPLDDLGDDLGDYQITSQTLNRNVMDAPMLSATEAGVLSDGINDLQANVTNTRRLVTDTTDRLVGWIRLAGFVGFFVGLWSLWAQLMLLRRGWRGLAGRKF